MALKGRVGKLKVDTIAEFSLLIGSVAGKGSFYVLFGVIGFVLVAVERDSFGAAVKLFVENQTEMT